MKEFAYRRRVGWLLLALASAPAVGELPDGRKFDLSTEKVLYCVGYAHLDTQWRWDFTTTIDKFIRNTLEHNFDRFEKYPGYVFNFTGSVRYGMMKEYYPEHYENLKKHIAAGRWFVSGSSVDEGDVNVPSAEATIRQVLYGNGYFRREFGKESLDFMLPDCFGFPASMPSVWAHCGLLGFSTQKLTWGSAVGIPFPIGVWEGLDGQSVIAAFDPGAYVGAIEGRVDTNPKWVERVYNNGRKYGVWADYHYYGVGDQGGAPREEDVANYLASMGNPDGRIRVALVSSDQMFKDITPQQRARLPRYRGDLLLTEHSAGTLTSQAYMKRWNRKNELLADAAERLAVAADWLGAAPYPLEKLNRSWERLLANQMHDILPGTSIPRAYTFSWNDEIVAANGFAAVLTDSVGAVAAAMNTRAEGVALLVYNPLAIQREDLVEAAVTFDGPAPPAVRVFGPEGQEVPSQILKRHGGRIKVVFAADVPSVSLSVFDVRPADEPYAEGGELRATADSLENEHYRVRLNEAGDVASLYDKRARREMLESPARLVFTREKPANWPAWNMDWADRQHDPIGAVEGPARIRVDENGPVRAAIEVRRSSRNSEFTQRIRLSGGAGAERVEFVNEVDWQSTECALKASFPLTVSHDRATYNWGMGTIERTNNDPVKYEVPSHEWFDLTDRSGEYGVSILEDCKFGSDKPSDNVVRLTLLYTPGVRHSYLDQHSQDWGRHEFVYALYGHRGDWRDARSEWQGRRVNQPLVAFTTGRHDGPLGREFSLVSVNTGQVDVRAVKRAEASDEIIVRVQELWGREADRATLAFHAEIASAHEVDGQERRVGDATIHNGKLVFNVGAYRPRSFAVRLRPPGTNMNAPHSVPVELPFDTDVASTDDDPTDGGMDSAGRTFPAEMLPVRLDSEGVTFELGPTASKAPNAVSCRGQTIPLPKGDFDKLYLLAAGSEDTTGSFRVGDRATDLSVQAWTGYVGQWDDRVWDTEFKEVDHRCEGKVVGITPGFIQRDPIAWFATHRHHPARGNEAYRFSYLFKYRLDVPAGATSVTLPADEKIKVFAATLVANDHAVVAPAQALYDDFTDRAPIRLRHVYPPPPRPVFEGERPLATATVDRAESFTALSIGPPVVDDFADASAGHGLRFRFSDGRGDYRPHPRSGAAGDAFPRLNDGDFARNDDDTARCVWYDNGGRFHVDLGRRVSIRAINTYSWHRSNRAPQFFSVWGSTQESMPDAAIEHERLAGWTLIGVVDTRKLGDGGVHGSSISAGDRQAGRRGQAGLPGQAGRRGRAGLPGQADLPGPIGPFRHLLWAIEDVGQGTFFTEIDIHVVD